MIARHLTHFTLLCYWPFLRFSFRFHQLLHCVTSSNGMRFDTIQSIPFLWNSIHNNRMNVSEQNENRKYISFSYFYINWYGANINSLRITIIIIIRALIISSMEKKRSNNMMEMKRIANSINSLVYLKINFQWRKSLFWLSNILSMFLYNFSIQSQSKFTLR